MWIHRDVIILYGSKHFEGKSYLKYFLRRYLDPWGDRAITIIIAIIITIITIFYNSTSSGQAVVPGRTSHVCT